MTDDPGLAATVCSAVGEEGEYIAVIPCPRQWHPAVRARDLVLSFNTIAKVAPEVLLILDSDPVLLGQMQARFGPLRVAQATTREEALNVVQGILRTGLSGVLSCQPTELGRALLEAKRLRRLLYVDEGAPPLSGSAANPSGSGHVVAVDDTGFLSQVIAADYAFSIDADLIILPPRADTFRETAYAAVDARHTHRGLDRGLRAEVTLRNIEEELRPSLAFGTPSFVSFITNGFPYGYFYKQCPSTHLFSSNASHSIVSGIHAFQDSSTHCALLIDPGDFPDSETAEIAGILLDGGSVIVELKDARATVHNSRLFITGMPYDFLFVCSHCGEMGGTRITLRIPDHNGEPHLVEFDTVAAMASDPREIDGRDMVLINELFIPVSIDGIDWFASPEDMRVHFWQFLQNKKMPADRDTLKREAVPRVSHSTAIKLYDGVLLLNMVQGIDANVSPVVFNNSCVSFFDAARALTFAGARSYIGTLAPVEDEYARNIAKTVINAAECRVSLPLALHRAQEALSNGVHEHIYVHVGCHFNRLVQPTGNSDAVHRERIRRARLQWETYGARATGHGKDHALELVEFLRGLEPNDPD